MKKLSSLFITATFTLFCFNAAFAQNSLQDDQMIKADEVVNIVNSGRFKLKIEHIKPTQGKGYEVKISPDTIMAYLPDLQRVRMRPNDSLSSNSTQFTCVNFEHGMSKDDKGNWVIGIRPKQPDMADIRQIRLTINPLGYATMNITTGRGVTTLSGYIKQPAY